MTEPSAEDSSRTAEGAAAPTLSSGVTGSLGAAVAAALASVSVPPGPKEVEKAPGPEDAAAQDQDAAVQDAAVRDAAVQDAAVPVPDASEPIEPRPAQTATDPAEHSEEAPVESAPVESVESAPVAGDTPSGPTSDVDTSQAAADDAVSASAISVEYYGHTDVGLVREHNEDNFLVVDLTAGRRGTDGAVLNVPLGPDGMLLAVCDGMGGAAAGEVASQMAVDTLAELFQAAPATSSRDVFATRLVRAVEEAGLRIFSAAKMDRSRRGMGTTSTVAGLIDGTLFVGQVGDSRAYILRGDQIALITKDQSLVNQLIEAGQLTEEEAENFEHSNIILQALGTTEEVTVDLTFLELRRGDRLLMCSDGLSGLVHADMMKDVLRSTPDLRQAAEALIAMANSGGGHDNITVVLAEFGGASLPEPTADVKVAYQQYPLPPETESTNEALGIRPGGMKAGGAKPGADRMSSDGDPDAPAASSWATRVLLAVAIVAVAAAVYIFASSGG